MNVELVIKSTGDDATIALLHDRKLIELHIEKKDNQYSVGDVYLGRVKKVVSGLNAAFVDVGYEKDAFLHYLDLGPQFQSLNKYVKGALAKKSKSSALDDFKREKDIDKSGKIDKVLNQNDHLLVQIAKEPISTKGPRITTEITFAGRYLVLVPFSDRISLSSRIKKKEERDRLKRLITSIKPANCGVIIRTVAENKKVAQLDGDLRNLVKKWELCHKELIDDAKPPKKIVGEIDRTAAILRDLLNSSFNNIHINDGVLAGEIQGYLERIAPEQAKIVRHYKSKTDIFEHFNIERQIKGAFGKFVTLPSGAYLVVEHTEALHVVDVNSGNTAKSSDNQEANALRVNLEAAEEIARQLRLRDMGGIIVVDFIDLRQSENRKKLFHKMKDAMAGDKAKHNVLSPSKFGLVQITRQRVRPEMEIKTAEACPTCDGTGEVQASILVMDEIENNIRYLLKEKKMKRVTLQAHPFIEAYIKKGFPSLRMKWYTKYKKWVDVKPVTKFHLLEYKFFDAKGKELEV